MPAPLVSILMPTYNGADRIGDALGSVLTQTEQDWEMIVVVDGSTDETDAVLAGLAEPFGERLRVVRQPNAGGGAALNRAMQEARGEYVAILDDDDTWRPRKLEVQRAFMEARPECIGCSVVWETTARPGVPICDPAALCDARGIVQRPIRQHFGHVFWRPSFTFMRRDAMAGLPFSPIREVPYDREFDLAFFARGPIGIAGGGEILGRYRIHASNVSKRPERAYLGTLRLRALDRQGHFDHLDAAQRDDFEHFMGRRTRHVIIEQLQFGDRRRALDLFRREWRSLLHARAGLFALALPALAAAPRSVLARAWPTRGVLHGTAS